MKKMYDHLEKLELIALKELYTKEVKRFATALQNERSRQDLEGRRSKLFAISNAISRKLQDKYTIWFF